MKRSRFVLTAIIAALAGVCLAQQPETAPPQSLETIPADVLMAAELAKSLDAKKIKAGDPVEAKISVDLLSNGQIVIPRNTKIIGHITSAKPRSKDSPQSSIGIAFDRIVMKDGRQIALKAVIQAMAPPLPINNLAPGTPGAGDSSPRGQQSGNTGTGQLPRTATNSSGTYPGMSTAPASNPNRVPVLTPQSQGAVGMNKITLSSEGEATVISSDGQNVHLDAGTQLMLRSGAS
jgi:hypothetical protein